MYTKERWGGCKINIINQQEEDNMNVRAAYIHVIGDAIQSVGVIAASVIIYFGGPEYTIADPICTYVFAVLVMGTTIPIMSESIRALNAPDGGKSWRLKVWNFRSWIGQDKGCGERPWFSYLVSFYWKLCSKCTSYH